MSVGGKNRLVFPGLKDQFYKPRPKAIMKCSYHIARRFGLKDRGLIRAGMVADVIVFDASRIADESTYDDGKALAVGMEHAVVNGEAVLQGGKRTAALPGRRLRRG